MAGGLFVYMGRGDQRREVKLGIQCLAEGARLMPWTDGGADPMFRDLFYAVIMQKLGVGTSPHHHEPRTFKSRIYTLRLICTCLVAQALSITTFGFRKDVELTKLFKITYRVVFRGRRPDFRDFKSRSKIACNFTKTKYFENLKVGWDNP
jgi:hypothetical protein